MKVTKAINELDLEEVMREIRKDHNCPKEIVREKRKLNNMFMSLAFMFSFTVIPKMNAPIINDNIEKQIEKLLNLYVDWVH